MLKLNAFYFLIFFSVISAHRKVYPNKSKLGRFYFANSLTPGSCKVYAELLRVLKVNPLTV